LYRGVWFTFQRRALLLFVSAPLLLPLSPFLSHPSSIMAKGASNAKGATIAREYTINLHKRLHKTYVKTRSISQIFSCVSVMGAVDSVGCGDGWEYRGIA
jgi:hypothetical protein